MEKQEIIDNIKHIEKRLGDRDFPAIKRYSMNDMTEEEEYLHYVGILNNLKRKLKRCEKEKGESK